jgi:hypothetical protein
MRKIIKTVTFDWDSALGDTIKEKYEALYVFLAEQEKLLTPNKGQLTVQAAETICSIFECTGSWGYYNKDIVPFFVNGVLRYYGNINNRWDLWLDPFMSFEELWLYNDDGLVKVLIDNLTI